MGIAHIHQEKSLVGEIICIVITERNRLNFPKDNPENSPDLLSTCRMSNNITIYVLQAFILIVLLKNDSYLSEGLH